MSHQKSDEPFGLLPKKTAMDLDRTGELFPMAPPRESEPTAPQDQRFEAAGSQQTGAEASGAASPWKKQF